MTEHSASNQVAAPPPSPLEEPRFRPHPVQWTREKSARFWDHIAPKLNRTGTYFGKQLGESLLRFVRKSGVPLTGRVLDFGCGPGHLMAHLVRQGVPVAGADFSPGAVATVRETLGHSPLFRGVELIESLPTQYEAKSFDVVFLIETVEHLLDADLEATIAELARIVKPGGRVVVSTPNDEDRAVNETICPDCGCIFHVMQHVRSWTADSLSALMRKHGFRAETVAARYFMPTRLHTLAFKALSRRRPHLVYIGVREGG